MKQQPSHRKPGGFFEGKGFYIALFLCVAAIGISGYYLFSGLFPQSTDPAGPETLTAVSGQAEMEGERDFQTITGTDASPTEETPPAGTAAAPEDPDRDSEPAASQEKAEPTAPPDEEKAASTAYVWPVQGEVQRDFSLEVFAYDATMGDWRTHDGLDVAAEVGAPVCACGPGSVVSVTEDDMMGVTVTVDHGNGIQSVYANLADSLNVQEGSEVEAGTVIGTVGTSAISESASPSHLHFAMVEYGVSIDPLHYLH